MSTDGGRLAASNEAHPSADVRHGAIPKPGGSAILSGDSRAKGTRLRPAHPSLWLQSHAVRVTGMSTTWICEPSMALTS
jgi:hypothetical protein